MYYAAVNAYGSETSPGFANTWDVVAFNTKRDRDAYCDTDNQGVVPVTRKKARIYSRSVTKVLDSSGMEIAYLQPSITL